MKTRRSSSAPSGTRPATPAASDRPVRERHRDRRGPRSALARRRWWPGHRELPERDTSSPATRRPMLRAGEGYLFLTVTSALLGGQQERIQAPAARPRATSPQRPREGAEGEVQRLLRHPPAHEPRPGPLIRKEGEHPRCRERPAARRQQALRSPIAYRRSLQGRPRHGQEGPPDGRFRPTAINAGRVLGKPARNRAGGSDKTARL